MRKKESTLDSSLFWGGGGGGGGRCMESLVAQSIYRTDTLMLAPSDLNALETCYSRNCIHFDNYNIHNNNKNKHIKY